MKFVFGFNFGFHVLWPYFVPLEFVWNKHKYNERIGKKNNGAIHPKGKI